MEAPAANSQGAFFLLPDSIASFVTYNPLPLKFLREKFKYYGEHF